MTSCTMYTWPFMYCLELLLSHVVTAFLFLQHCKDYWSLVNWPDMLIPEPELNLFRLYFFPELMKPGHFCKLHCPLWNLLPKFVLHPKSLWLWCFNQVKLGRCRSSSENLLRMDYIFQHISLIWFITKSLKKKRDQ